MEEPKTTRQIVDEYWRRQEKPKTVSEIVRDFWDRQEPETIGESHRPTDYRTTKLILESYHDGLKEPKTVSQIVDEYYEAHERPQEPDEPQVEEKPKAVKEPTNSPEEKPQEPDEPQVTDQVLEEPQVEEEITEFSSIVFEGGRTYHNVTNFKSEGKGFNKYEFDSEWHGTISHIEIQGFLTIKEHVVKKASKPEIIAKFCSTVFIYTNSGKEEKYSNVRNLTEDKDARIVEFDTDVDVDDWKGHMKISGVIEKYLEVFEKSGEEQRKSAPLSSFID